jgi:hypothetical protein
VYKVTRVEDVTKPGILIITMKEVEKNDNDRFDLGIADYWETKMTIPFEERTRINSSLEYLLTAKEEMGWIIKKSNTNQLTAHNILNSVEIPATFEFSLNTYSLPNNSVAITETTNTYIKIKNVSVENSTTISLFYREQGTLNWLEKIITLKNLWEQEG